MNNSSVHYCVDRFVPDQDAHLSVHDLGFSRGYTVFDVLRTYEKTPFHLTDHIQRFLFACQQMRLSLPYDFGTLCNLVQQLIDYNPYEYALIKLMASAGISLDGFTPKGTPLLYILCYPLNSPCVPSPSINVHTFDIPRLFPHVKTAFYLPALWMLDQLRPLGFNDLVYVDPDGFLLEGTRSNLFFIQGGQLITPQAKVLRGITKEVILRIASPYFTPMQRPIHFSEISSFEEAFLCASAREVMPIIRFNDYNFSSTEKSCLLHHKFREYVSQRNWPSLEISWDHEKSFSLNH